ncbi:hypothetical protein BDB00DRAFT_830086 [Zychaea mexicana]|uniref:uncharacterized protein n=1 Tax=Zychaea mexicana TaxID=64656 RepID=UPI0022FDDC79|nr:uncharacterized protein BDB00DRAFT_830086 [Zychaea mexicana]KAI9492077.1 hypothetical protein BDB00DRAFT_830086 [Zychaea mexicana]
MVSYSRRHVHISFHWHTIQFSARNQRLAGFLVTISRFGVDFPAESSPIVGWTAATVVANCMWIRTNFACYYLDDHMIGITYDV